MYAISDQSNPLRFLRVENVEDQVAGAHPTMRDELREYITRHNRAIDLMTAGGDFSSEWADVQYGDDGRPLVSEWAAGIFQTALDAICIELRTKQMPTQLADGEAIRLHVMAIKRADSAHPVARHWKVLAERCVPPGVTVDWGV